MLISLIARLSRPKLSQIRPEDLVSEQRIATKKRTPTHHVSKYLVTSIVVVNHMTRFDISLALGRQKMVLIIYKKTTPLAKKLKGQKR